MVRLDSMFSFIQRLFNARKHEAETEEHMRMLDEREVGRLRQEIGKVENELTNVNDRKSGLAVRNSACPCEDQTNECLWHVGRCLSCESIDR